jgi:glutamine amidotransferase
MITIIDYKMGNLGSIANMIKKIGGKSMITSDINEIANAEKLILPGVGAFDNAMTNLNEMNLLSVLNKKALEDKIPVLGICLGMQLLTNSSEEGTKPGLGWIDAEVVKFRFEGTNKKLKIPHMGWNTVEIKGTHPLFSDMYPEPRFYFVHSFYAKCKSQDNELTRTEYGFSFASAIHNGNIMGTQYHPEKSHKFGMKLLENFIKI